MLNILLQNENGFLSLILALSGICLTLILAVWDLSVTHSGVF